ncbi:uncharacterized protein LOC107018935 [Solanum pennellii]|uniref:Uncharacterized protein LOC107018935 n=1 Tax=Solanum pennellii TaxID=28526 RepID=A0ABM1GRY4_SOLPN|nr:uncharacterized protein LOC107018935 [Solanum pennellii]XP_015075016.1 uncharacterized protein LOC107018935 [Solanum pennellii]
MGDHFVFLVDRLLTESSLEAAIQSRDPKLQPSSIMNSSVTDCSSQDSDPLSPRKMVECRICQDEDVDSNMEVPCSCCGSLKYAHRRCVQRWCNEKGDTICEICHQPFRPGYTAPPPIFRLGGIPMNFRGNWGIVRRDLNNPRLIAVVSSNRNFINSDDYDDDYAVSTSRSMMCCRSVAMIFMLLLVLRHTLPIIVNQAQDYSFPLVMVLLLRIAGIVLPIYIIMKAVTSCYRRQRQQAVLPISSSDEESDPVIHQPPIIIAP